jgi:hypothetical protein
MKNTQKGFIIPLVIIVLVLAIASGSYVYLKQEKTPESAVTTNEPVSNNSNLDNINTEKENVIKGVKLLTEKASGIIKSVYGKDGKNYIDIDYVEFVSGGPNGVSMNNNNPKIRTFEISNNTKFLIRESCIDKGTCAGDEKEAITFKQFSDIFNKKDYSINNATYLKNNPWDIEITNGVITQITERFLP